MSSQTFSTFSEVGMIDARGQNGIITLPLSTDIPYRILTLKDIYGAAALSSITLTTQGADVFEDGTTSRLLNGAFETTTLYAGQAGFWYVTGGSRLATAAIGLLSTGVIANPLRLGTLSTQTAIQFPGLRSNYTGTVVAGQTTGVGTQELLLYQASSISDQIRLQTTGNIVFEAGAAARSWPSTAALATPTLYIAGSTSNVGIGTAAPATTLDVAGGGRFQTLSTVSLNVSSINGIIPGAAFIGSTNYISATTVQALTISTQSINVSSVNGILPGAAFNGSTLALSTAVITTSTLTTNTLQVNNYINAQGGSLSNLATEYFTTSKFTTTFTPPNVSGLQMWLDGADSSASSMLLSGQNILTWKDKSGNGFNASASNTVPLTQSAINGIQAVNFNGSGYLVAPIATGGAYYTRTTLSFIIVGALSNPTAGANLGLLCTEGTGGDWSSSGNFACTTAQAAGTSCNNVVTTRNGANTPAYPNFAPVAANPFIIIVQYDGTNGTMRYNGLQQGGTSSYTDAFAFSNYWLGNRGGGGGGLLFQGYFGEVITYSNVVPLSNIQKIEGYLSFKWGITLIDNAHPYYSAPPLPYGTAYTIAATLSIDSSSNFSIKPANTTTLIGNAQITSTLTASTVSTFLVNARTVSTPNLIISTINGQTFGAPIQSTVVGLGTAGYVSTSQLYSTVTGLAFTGSTLGLSAATIGVSTINMMYLSSVQGYISSLRTDNLTVGGPTGYVTIQDLTTGTVSTGQVVAGAGFISSLQINTLSFGPSGYVIVSNFIAASLSTQKLNAQNAYVNNLYVGNNSTQSAILFPGVDGAYKGTAIAEQVTGVGTEELLLYKVSTATDQIRLQTTGNIVFEAGAAARSWNSTTQLATPTLYIQGSSSNVGIGTAAPATTLDVAGTGRFQILSSYTLNVSSINGILPGAAFNGSTMGLSSATINTSSLVATQITTTNLIVNNGTQTINYNGGVATGAYGTGVDTLSLKSPLTAYNGGIASLFFGNGTPAYPLARIAALDTASGAPGASALLFQTTTAVANVNLSGVTTFQYTGADQSYTVPAGANSVTVYMWGAGGSSYQATGGAGAYIQGTLTVTPGQTLKIMVGQGGVNGSATPTYGGGGSSRGLGGGRASAGGRSAIQITLSATITSASGTSSIVTYTTNTAHGLAIGQPIIISGSIIPSGYTGTFVVLNVLSSTQFTVTSATTGTSSGTATIVAEIVDVGGGGSGGYVNGGAAAYSGTASAGSNAGSANGGSGGTQTAGGAAGTGGDSGFGLPTAGSILTGGIGADYGGGGGGGYYGGGGGPTAPGNASGGGGGSSYTTNASFAIITGSNSANGYSAPATGVSGYVSGVAAGGNIANGGPGLVIISSSPAYVMSEAMRINSNAYVGIGTATPQSLLHVSGMTYSIAVSTQALTISSINGQTFGQPIQSTVIGLGTAGYVSTSQLAATSNYFKNLLFLDVSTSISTATLYTSNTSNWSRNLLQDFSTPVSSVATAVSNTSNYFQNLLALNVSSAISTATLYTSNTSNYILSTNQSSISTAYIAAVQGYISTLVVDSLAIGSNSGFINMGDIITTSHSSLQINTGLFTASGAVCTPQITVSSINGQQPLTLANLTSTVTGTNSNISSMIDPTELTSTVTGLGTANFISTVGLTSILASTVTGINTSIAAMIDPTELTSTVTGLGTVNFISSVGLTTILTSTVIGVNTTIAAMIDPIELASSITGLGTVGFISSIGLDAKFASTTQGLGTAGYVSSLSNVTNVSTLNINVSTINGQTFGQPINSTVIGLGTAGYASTSYVIQQISSLSTAMGQVGASFSGSTISLSAGSIYASSVSTVQFWAQNVNAQAVSTNALIFGTGTGTLLMPDIAPNTVYTSTVTTSNVQVGWSSNQSPLQFYGYGTYSNTAIVEQSTGTTTQELLVFRGSNAADRIRFQTTGYMAIETGVSYRYFGAALSNAVPAVMIDINSNVGIQLATPAVPLDVGGTIRAPTLSSLTIQTSTIQGAIFTKDLYVNTKTFLQGEVSTSFLLGNYNTLNFITAGTQRATFTQAGNLGIGVAAPQFPVDIAGITRVSTIYNSTSISYNFISAPLLVASTVNTANLLTNSISTNQINASLIYGRWNDAQYYVLQTL